MKTIIIDDIEYNITPKIKFAKGDWIVNAVGDICLITEIDLENHFYLCTSNRFGETDGDIDLTDKSYHLWTIQDAKNGDVLAEDSCIFIIQKLGDNSTAAKTYCTLYDDGDFDDGSILYFDVDSTKPATKEQRELLFQKMKEAGYEWDEDKKELKKIKQKPTEENKGNNGGISPN